MSSSPQPEPTTGVLVIAGPIVDDDVPRLCDHLRALVAEGDAEVVVCDVRALPPDLPSVQALARLALTARRLGSTIRLRGASSQLELLLAFVGLADVVARGTCGGEH